MKTIQKLLLIAGSVSLLGLFLFPMWSIFLEAPQYQGENKLGILIYINKLEGARPTDLDNINGLNHYIGMKKIEPDSIQELRLMPWIIGGMTALGLLFALWGNRFAPLIWLILLSGLGAVGMWDFYMWEYDYGHNLDPHAAIQIPGMTYQPPLIGTMQLLNFTASSWPDIGFGFVVLGAALAALAAFGSLRNPNGKRPKAGLSVSSAAFVLWLILPLLSSCAKPEARAINYNQDECALCKMTISDTKFGAELVTTKGKQFVYDSPECMFQWLSAGATVATEVHSVWVTDFINPGKLIDATSATYLHSDMIRSPMGMNVASFTSAVHAERAMFSFPGKIIDYSSAVKLAQR